MKLRVALAQISSELGEVHSNAEKHISILNKLEDRKVDLICFPELSLTGYMIKDLAYELSDACWNEAIRIARRVGSRKRAILGAVVQDDFGFVYNAALTLGDHKVLGIVRKSYLPTYGLFEEKRYFNMGDPSHNICFNFGNVRYGVLICEDMWHPEPAEYLARLGSQIIFCLASSPVRGVHSPKHGKFLPIEDQWIALLKAQALMNNVFVAFVNRVGPEDEECFWGGSALVSPSGELLARAKLFHPDLVTAEIDLEEIQRVRRFSSFRDHMKRFHELLREL